MTYVETNVRSGQMGDSLCYHVLAERRLLPGDAPATR
jgi:hypothetical protein